MHVFVGAHIIKALLLLAKLGQKIRALSTPEDCTRKAVLPVKPPIPIFAASEFS